MDTPINSSTTSLDKTLMSPSFPLYLIPSGPSRTQSREVSSLTHIAGEGLEVQRGSVILPFSPKKPEQSLVSGFPVLSCVLFQKRIC